MYSLLNEEDMWAGLWQQRCRYPETATAIAYETQGFYEQAQSAYEVVRAIAHMWNIVLNSVTSFVSTNIAWLGKDSFLFESLVLLASHARRELVAVRALIGLSFDRFGRKNWKDLQQVRET